MNREIKFRGKTRAGKWAHGYYHAQHDYLYSEINHYIHEIGHLSSTDVIPETIGQYTGLKDNNGVDIYEGDICRIIMRKLHGHERDGLSRPLGSVEYSRLSIREDSLYTFDTFNIRGRSIHYLLSMELEVIGNIHDNPELLKGANP